MVYWPIFSEDDNYKVNFMIFNVRVLSNKVYKCWLSYNRMETESAAPETLNSFALSKSGTAAQDLQTDNGLDQGPLFFNYHEFAENFYAEVESPHDPKEHDGDHNICVTHFPNVFVPKDSAEFHSTRIVRIPRRFDVTLNAPYFSNCLPGWEPAALNSEEEGKTFQARGIYDNDQLYGYSSVSPLSWYLSQSEFAKIVTPINEILGRSYGIYTWHNIVNLVLDVLTIGCWYVISRHFFDDPTQQLERYISQVNNSPALKNHNIKIISPRRSGYLSVRIEVICLYFLVHFTNFFTSLVGFSDPKAIALLML